MPLKIILTNNLRLSNIPGEIRAKLMDTLTFPNPKWLENHRMGRWNRGTPKLLKFYDKTRGGGLWDALLYSGDALACSPGPGARLLVAVRRRLGAR